MCPCSTLQPTVDTKIAVVGGADFRDLGDTKLGIDNIKILSEWIDQLPKIIALSRCFNLNDFYY